MKKTMNWLLAAALICGFSMDLTSCSDNSDNPVPAPKKYRLIQCIEVNTDGDTTITDYGYDTQGRMETYVRVSFPPSPSEPMVEANHTYIYGDHYIIEKHWDVDYTYYTLNDDGLIIKEEERKEVDKPSTPNYIYQYADGRVISYQDPEIPGVSNIHWEDDLMYFVREGQEGNVDKTEFTRTQLSVDYGYMNAPLSTMNHALFMMGYYGKPSKHLESHCKIEALRQGMSSLFEFDYTYTIADGHIVEMVKNSTSKVQMPLFEKILNPNRSLERIWLVSNGRH